MSKKDIDWSNIGFGYMPTEARFVSNYKDGAWDEGVLTADDKVVISECAGVLQYAQTCFEGLKAYRTKDGKVVCFRPDLNASRMADSCKRLEMPVYPEDKWVEAIEKVVKANIDYVPPYGSGATLYIRPYMFGSNPVIGVKPANEYQFRVFVTPVGPYFKGGVKPITIRVSDFDRAAPHGTGHIKAGLNYAMSLHAIVDAHNQGFDENMYLDAATRTKVEETGGANFIFVTKDNKIVNNEIVEQVKKAMPEEESLYDVAELFKVFGDSTRIRIICALFDHEMCVYDLAACLDMTQSAISHQLRILKAYKLVKNRRDGKMMYYSLDDEHVKLIFEAGYSHIMEDK